jgi:hypothetical protein
VARCPLARPGVAYANAIVLVSGGNESRSLSEFDGELCAFDAGQAAAAAAVPRARPPTAGLPIVIVVSGENDGESTRTGVVMTSGVWPGGQ